MLFNKLTEFPQSTVSDNKFQKNSSLKESLSSILVSSFNIITLLIQETCIKGIQKERK